MNRHVACVPHSVLVKHAFSLNIDDSQYSSQAGGHCHASGHTHNKLQTKGIIQQGGSAIPSIVQLPPHSIKVDGKARTPATTSHHPCAAQMMVNAVQPRQH